MRRATAERWITACFGAPEGLVYVGEGEDFYIYRTVDGRGAGWAYRFPKSADSVPHLRAEIRVLPALQHLPLAIPLPERVAEPGDDRPGPVVGYRWLPGVSADRVDDLDPDVVLDALEAFLEAVHAVPRRAPFDSTVGWPLLPVEDVAHPVARRVVDWLAANPAPAVSDVFSHQDLGLGHVLVDPKTGRPTGVIDWGDMHWGDPATDWVGVLARWPEAVTARLAPEVVARAHRLHLMFALQDVLYGTEVDRSEGGLAQVWARLQALLERVQRAVG